MMVFDTNDTSCNCRVHDVVLDSFHQLRAAVLKRFHEHHTTARFDTKVLMREEIMFAFALPKPIKQPFPELF